MKKLVLTVALVVLLAAAVFAGQALASSKPADVTVSEETLSNGGGSLLGYPLLMETLSGNVTLEQEIGGINENYPGVRHVSLTLHIAGLDDASDIATLQVYFGDTFAPDLADLADLDNDSNKVQTYEFDAERWTIQAQDDDGDPIVIRYHATITYPSNAPSNAPTSAPTLSQWGMIGMALVLAAALIWSVRSNADKS